MSKKQSKGAKDNIRHLQLSIIVGYALIVGAAILIVYAFTIQKTDAVLKKKVSTLTASLNVQMKLNMDSFLSRMEKTGTLVFAEEEVYTYDPITTQMDEYDALTAENAISDRLDSLSVMENFVDFAIVYSNNHTVGKLSNGTTYLFGDALYEDLYAMISRQRTNDGWATGYAGDFRRIYYVKQVHEHALLVISFYATELENVFDNPETLGDMEIRLTQDSYMIIYSSEEEEIGTVLPEQIYTRVQDQTAATIMDDEYLVTISECGDSWHVICSIPTAIILEERNDMQLYILIVAAVAALLAVAVGTLLSFKLTQPVDTYVSRLNTQAHNDQLTGVLNKSAFESFTETALRCADEGNGAQTAFYALILLDVDNFKGVNDTLGHAYGDRVLAQIGDILRAVFHSEDFLGRIGGDEFAVCMRTDCLLPGEAELSVRMQCEALCEKFHENYTGDDGSYKISASIGVALYPKHGRNFAELYRRADKALYKSKQKGKDTYTIFEE